MIALIKRIDQETDHGFVVVLKEGTDLDCFDFYVQNGYWWGTFVGGTVEVDALYGYRIADGTFGVFLNHPSAVSYMEVVNREQKLKAEKHAKEFGDLDIDQPF